MKLYNQFVIEIESADTSELPEIEERVQRALNDSRITLSEFALLAEELKERVTE